MVVFFWCLVYSGLSSVHSVHVYTGQVTSCLTGHPVYYNIHYTYIITGYARSMSEVSSPTTRCDGLTTRRGNFRRFWYLTEHCIYAIYRYDRKIMRPPYITSNIHLSNDSFFCFRSMPTLPWNLNLISKLIIVQKHHDGSWYISRWDLGYSHAGSLGEVSSPHNP